MVGWNLKFTNRKVILKMFLKLKCFKFSVSVEIPISSETDTIAGNSFLFKTKQKENKVKLTGEKYDLSPIFLL